MAVKKHYKYRKKQRSSKYDAKTEKLAARVYACIILCAFAFALSKTDSDYGRIMRQKIKFAINSNITFEQAEEVLSLWSGKIGLKDINADLFETEEEI